jgi:hypothetical protein
VVSASSAASGGALETALGHLYELVDEATPTAGVWAHYALYMCLTALLIVLLANILQHLLVTAVIYRLPGSVTLGFRRDRRASDLAAELLPNSRTARSDIAKVFVHRDSAKAALYNQGGNDGDGDRSGTAVRDMRYVATRREESKWKRAQRLQNFAPEGQLRLWGWMGYVKDRLIETTHRIFRMFGGTFTYVGRPSDALRPTVLVLAAAAVLWVRPIKNQGITARRAATTAWQKMGDVTPSRLLPLLVLAIGVLIVVRPTPLIDRIRARDEAAKDANRLLSELYGGLTHLYYALSAWLDYLKSERTTLLEEWVEQVTDQEYTWRFRGGLELIGDSWRHSPTRSEHGDVSSEMETAISAITDIDQSLRDKGLTRVALRLTYRVSRSIIELGLMSPYPTWDASRLHSVFYSPSNLERVQRDAAMVNAVGVRRRDDAAAPDYFEQRLESAAFNRARYLDLSIAEIERQQLHLQRVRTHLNSRMLGSWWTRSLSVLQK